LITEGSDIVPLSAMVMTGQRAACWAVVTKNGRYGYVINAGTRVTPLTGTGRTRRPGRVLTGRFSMSWPQRYAEGKTGMAGAGKTRV